MQPLEIADSKILHSRTVERLIIKIPSYPHFRQFFKIANRKHNSWIEDDDNIFIEATSNVILISSGMYLAPLAAILGILSELTLLNIWFVLIASAFLAGYFTSLAFCINGLTSLELTPKGLKLSRKVNLFGYGIRIKTADIRQVKFRPWRKIYHNDTEPRVLCYLVTKRKSYQFSRAISRVEAEKIVIEIGSFLQMYR